MISDRYSKAWPNKQYDGNEEDYDEFNSDRIAWCVDNGYDLIDETDPSTTPRVLVAYDDETGKHFAVESLTAYTRRINEDRELNKKMWAKAIRGFTGYARKIADAAGEQDGRKVFAAIKKEYGTKSSKQVTNLVRSLNTKTKTQNQTIVKFNSEWRNAVKSLETNSLHLEEPYLINLYLISLGKQYRTLESMVAVMPLETRTLAHVMKLAIDHPELEVPDEQHDEAYTQQVAMLARRTRKRKHQDQALALQEFTTITPCDICGNRYHGSAECFDGGLKHFNSKEKRNWIQTKRREREASYSPSKETPKSKEISASAYSALELQRDKYKQILRAHGYECDETSDHGVAIGDDSD
jgi:hypothetical protein